jgi:hypothetical protein
MVRLWAMPTITADLPGARKTASASVVEDPVDMGGALDTHEVQPVSEERAHPEFMQLRVGGLIALAEEAVASVAQEVVDGGVILRGRAGCKWHGCSLDRHRR